MKINKINNLDFSISMFIVIFFMSCLTTIGQSIVVNSTNYKQLIDMMGGDMERSSIAVQKAQNKEDIFQWSFGDIDFNVCRVQYDKNQEINEGVKNWSFYDKQVATMQAIKAINPMIKFFGTMRSDYDGFGDDNNMPDWIHTYSTKATDVEKYGIFLADYCEYMSQQGVPISMLSTAKEWMWHVRASEVEDIIHTLNTELVNRGIEKPMIIDQGFWSIKAGVTYLNNVESLGTKDLYSAFCSHNYANEDPESWVEIIEKAVALGKPMYDDETSTGSGSPTYGVERAMFKQIDEYIKKAERYKAGLSGEIYFEIWSRGINKETRAIYYPASGMGRRLRGYYMMKQFSNNVLGYTYVTSSVDNMSNVYTITFRKDDKIVLWVINENDTEYTMPIRMDNSTITSEISTRYWTNNTVIEGAEATYTSSGNTFIPIVEGESMNCYIFNVTENVVDVCNYSNELIEAECYDVMSGVEIEANLEGTESVSRINDGDWIQFKNVDFSNDVELFSARVASSTIGGNVELRTGSPTGTLVGILKVDATGGLQNYATITTDISKLTGIQDLYLVFTGASGDLFNVNWVKLTAAPALVSLNATGENKSVILNWSVENIELGNQYIYRNTYLSETGRTLIAENVSGTSFTDTNVSNRDTYWYWVEAIDNTSVITRSNIVEATPSIPNLALASKGSIATQSSTAYEGPAELAIDGSTDGDYGNGSVSHTAHGANGVGLEKWWQVALQADYNIETIIVYNRTGSTKNIERLNNFTVEVIDSNDKITFTQLYTSYPNPSVTIHTGGAVGSVIKISKTSDYGLTLAEVEVYGEDRILFNNIIEKNKTYIYPNPVMDVFTITNCNDAFIEIYDTLGKRVLTKKIESDNQSIDVSQFKSGIYFIETNKNGNLTNLKIIKK